MTDVNEVLNRLAEARGGYKDFVDAVDADLRRERQKRLAVRTGEIMSLVAEAYVAGASKRAIMRAYDTKDFRTIDSMLSTMQEQIELMRAEIAAQAETPDWLEYLGNERVGIHGAGYEIVALEDDEYLLVGDAPTQWDGIIVSGRDAVGSEAEIIWRTIKEEQS